MSEGLAWASQRGDGTGRDSWEGVETSLDAASWELAPQRRFFRSWAWYGMTVVRRIVQTRWRGRAAIRVDGIDSTASPGSIAYLQARAEHRFHGIE